MSIEDKALELVGQALSLLSQKENNVSDTPEIKSDLIEKVKMFKRASILDDMAEVLASSGNDDCSSKLRSLSDRVKTAAKKKLEDKKEEPTMKQKNETKLRDISAALDSKGHFKFASLILDMADRLKEESCGNCSDCSCGEGAGDAAVEMLPIAPEPTSDIPDNTIDVVKVSEAPDFLKKLMVTMKATNDLVDLYKSSISTGNKALSDTLPGIIQRTAAQSQASSPLVVKSLEDRFKGLPLEDPQAALDAFKGVLKELETAFSGGIKKVKECDVEGFKAMAKKTQEDIAKDPSKAKDGLPRLISGLSLFIRSIDQSIKNTFRDYNSK